MKLKHLDLCSGIGGFSAGFERTGAIETVAFCEKELYPQYVLKKHWPHVPLFDDVKELAYEDFPHHIDILTAGYPCQPFSLAGERRGAGDDRHLWPDVFRLVREYRPAWFVGENVIGHISMGLDEVIDDLESEGYACRAFDIPAVAVDARHIRQRLWIVAHADGARELQPCGSEREVRGWPGDGREDVAHADVLGSPGPRGAEGPSYPAAQAPWQEHRADDDGGWPDEPDLPRVAHGIPCRVDRISALGNSIVPEIATRIGRAIAEIEKGV